MLFLHGMLRQAVYAVPECIIHYNAHRLVDTGRLFYGTGAKTQNSTSRGHCRDRIADSNLLDGGLFQSAAGTEPAGLGGTYRMRIPDESRQ
jgi:hypothetical protein